jgi:hypothetical protein
VGTRIRGPYSRHLDWYATKLGFVFLTKYYEPDVDPTKNFPPLITRTQYGCEINFIPNCSSAIPEAGEGSENALTANSRLTPGILYTTLEIDCDCDTAFNKLKASGIDVTIDELIMSSSEAQAWGDFPSGKRALRPDSSGPTLLIRDLNGSVWRLLPRVGGGQSEDK